MLNQNDYIMRQIYQLTQVLEKVIAAVIGLKGQKQSQEAIQITNQAFTEHLELDLEMLLEMDSEVMIQKLEAKDAMNHENLESVADLFYELAKNESKEKSEVFIKRSLQIYEHIEATGSIYSIERNNKIQEIKQHLG